MEIVVLDSVRVIGSGAFADCEEIKSTAIPFIGSQSGNANTKDVFAYIFAGSVPASLKKVTVTNETYVPQNAFKDCANIEIININNTVLGIGARAFDGCAKLY